MSISENLVILGFFVLLGLVPITFGIFPKLFFWLFSLIAVAKGSSHEALERRLEDAEKGVGWFSRTAAVVLGVVVLVVVADVQSILDLETVWNWLQALGTQVRDHAGFALELAVLIVSALILVGVAVTLEVVRRTARDLRSQLKSVLHEERRHLAREREDLVTGVRDSTRHVLTGFAEIMDKALVMISEAKEHVTFVNFAMNFGEAHEGVTVVERRYQLLPLGERYISASDQQDPASATRDLSRDTVTFFKRLNDLAGNAREFRVVTLDRSRLGTGFLNPLSERDPYKEHFDTEVDVTTYRVCQDDGSGGPGDGGGECVEMLASGKSSSVNLKDAVSSRERKRYIEYLASRIALKNDWLRKRMDSRRFVGNWKEGFFGFSDSLPLQILITDKARGASTKALDDQGHLCCLVFLVGTEYLQGGGRVPGEDPIDERPIELGFYSDLPQIVRMYKNLAEGLMEQSKKRNDSGFYCGH